MAESSTEYTSHKPNRRRTRDFQSRAPLQPRSQSSARSFCGREIVFENVSPNNEAFLCFVEFYGHCDEKHKTAVKFLARNHGNPTKNVVENYTVFTSHLKNLLERNADALREYTINISLGIIYYLSVAFNFQKLCRIDDLTMLVQGRILSGDERFYRDPNDSPTSLDAKLRSHFHTTKPVINENTFISKLNDRGFIYTDTKDVFRVFLKMFDYRTCVCSVEPKNNYSINEIDISNETSFIDFVTDRNTSRYQSPGTYQDIFDFRIKFRKNRNILSDEQVIKELTKMFPELTPDFKNEQIIMKKISPDNKEYYQIHPGLAKYCNYVRLDSRNQYTNENYKFYQGIVVNILTSTEFYVDRESTNLINPIRSPALISSIFEFIDLNDEQLLMHSLTAFKIWDIAKGLCVLASQCSE